MALSACQTSRSVSFAYHDATFGGDSYKRSDKTSVLFLMDGFSSEMLRTCLAAGTCPAIADAFSLGAQGRFALGRAVFPSLTFPNITSILTSHPVSEHPICGNRVVVDGSVMNFENPINWSSLGRLLQRRTVFYKLGERNETSVSYAYAFTGGATAFQTTDAAVADSYLDNDFASIDASTIESLHKLLSETEAAKWPRFIFVHLIGIDATAHHNGPLDESVQDYIHRVDGSLKPIFDLLDHPNGLAAATHDVSYAMTADHGFRATPDHSPLEEVVENMNRNFRIVADNRVAPLWIDEKMEASGRLELARALLEVPHVGWAAVKTAEGFELLRRNGDHARVTLASPEASSVCASTAPTPAFAKAARFEWVSHSHATAESEFRVGPARAPASAAAFTCLTDYDLATSADDDSYIVPALVDYFAASGSPDLVFVPDDHSDFASGYRGNHGGLSREEMLVPVLTHDVRFPHGIHPTSQILREMGVLDH